MKTKLQSTRSLCRALLGLALAGSMQIALPATDMTLGTFETDLSGYFSWGRGWGGDSAVGWDSGGMPGGSLTAHGLLNSTNSDTPVCVYAVNAGNPWWHPNAPFDMTQYKALEFDIKWNNDPTNIPLSQFNYPSGDPEAWSTMGIEIGSLYTNADNVVLTNMPIPAAAANGWVHVTIPINPALARLDQSYGIWIRKWICNPPANPGDWQTGHVITNNGYYEFYLDNVVLISSTPLPPPTLSAPVAAVPGENFIAASAGQYDRQEIRTVATNYSWIGAAGPVTYSVDVAQLGESSAPAILFFHWIPGGAAPNRNDSDWHEPNVLMWRIGNNANGTAWSSLHYKTNAPDNNGHLYDSGNLGGPGSASGKGTWTITFNGNTTVTMTSADGTTLTTNLPPEVIDVFQTTPGMQVNIGQVPNSGPTPMSQISVVTAAKFTGTPTPLDSNFLVAAPDANIWTALSTGPNGVQWLSPASKLWLAWTLPANGFGLQGNAKVSGGSWTSLPSGGFDAAGKRHVLLAQADLPGAQTGFFNLLKRVPTKLQVLMPGETAAPGTPTGKTGTPTPQVAGFEFDVVVNLVDDNWNLVPVTGQTIKLNTDDDTTVILPPDATTLNGTATMKLTLWLTATTYTVTVTGVTTPTLTPGTAKVTTLPP